MTGRQRRLAHTASRPIGWALFFAVLASPLGAYLYLGRPWRLLGFVLLFAAGMAAVGSAIEAFGWPMGVADAAVAVMALGALADLALTILSSRRELRRDGLEVPALRP